MALHAKRKQTARRLEVSLESCDCDVENLKDAILQGKGEGNCNATAYEELN